MNYFYYLANRYAIDAMESVDTHIGLLPICLYHAISMLDTITEEGDWY